jgi:DNA-binding NarL/FixJ family response regulator
MKSRIIIADDHLVVRQGLRDILHSRPDWEVVAEAADGVAAEDQTRRRLADLLILDIGLPLRRGVAVCERLRADGILIPILFFSMYPPSQYAPVARRLGAQGFIGKDATAAGVLSAVDLVLRGYTCFPGAMEPAPPGPTTRDPNHPFAALSPRELEVCRGLVAGTSLVKLSRQMGLNSKTLSTYRQRVLAKLGVGGNAELVALAILHGFH